MNELYHKYHDGDNGAHFCVEMNNVTEILKLIDSCEDGNIRIWNFDSGTLLSKIKVSEVCLYGFCSFSNNYIYVGSQDKIMRLVDIIPKIPQYEEDLKNGSRKNTRCP